jgi:hypothetical protein
VILDALGKYDSIIEKGKSHCGNGHAAENLY